MKDDGHVFGDADLHRKFTRAYARLGAYELERFTEIPRKTLWSWDAGRSKKAQERNVSKLRGGLRRAEDELGSTFFE